MTIKRKVLMKDFILYQINHIHHTDPTYRSDTVEASRISLILVTELRMQIHIGLVMIV